MSENNNNISQIKVSRIKIDQLYDEYLYSGRVSDNVNVVNVSHGEKVALIEMILLGLDVGTLNWLDDSGNYLQITGYDITQAIFGYINNEFSVNGQYIHNLHNNDLDTIYNYKVKVVLNSTNNVGLLIDWVKEVTHDRLNLQEIRNIMYHGSFVNEASKWFSKTGCPAHAISAKFFKCRPNRHELLDLALEFISDGEIDSYMIDHRYDDNTDDLWIHFQNVIKWYDSTSDEFKDSNDRFNLGVLYNENSY